ncbi:hypothetical protein EW145_g3228 [Phellinidium pouzarii]|uniref:Uncharacterized protein n=1 Tax=Phellinidium pouzarii TaxID=167371 RepID=A0A4S4L7U0_9AGAM|nr:hypothetical protein EW145_g3228 [Phellinidium pouzarii]
MTTVNIEFANTGKETTEVSISDSEQNTLGTCTIRPNHIIRQVVPTCKLLYLTYKRECVEQYTTRSFKKYVMIDVNHYFVSDTEPEIRGSTTTPRSKSRHAVPVERSMVADMVEGFSRFFQIPAIPSLESRTPRTEYVGPKPSNRDWKCKEAPVNPPGIVLGAGASRPRPSKNIPEGAADAKDAPWSSESDSMGASEPESESTDVSESFEAADEQQRTRRNEELSRDSLRSRLQTSSGAGTRAVESSHHDLLVVKDRPSTKTSDSLTRSKRLAGDSAIAPNCSPYGGQKYAVQSKLPADKPRPSRNNEEAVDPRMRSEEITYRQYLPNVNETRSRPRLGSKSTESYERLPGSGRTSAKRPSYTRPIAPQSRDSQRSAETYNTSSEIFALPKIESREEKYKVTKPLESPLPSETIEGSDNSRRVSSRNSRPLRTPSVGKVSPASDSLNEAVSASNSRVLSPPSITSSEKWKRAGESNTSSVIGTKDIVSLEDAASLSSSSSGSSGGKWVRASRRNAPKPARTLNKEMPSTPDILREALGSSDETESSSSSSSSSGEKWQRARKRITPGPATPVQNVEVGEKDISLDQAQRIVLDALMQHAAKQ